MAIPSEAVPGEAGQDLLARAAVASALLVPIVWHGSQVGVLLLGSQRRGLTHRDWGTFAEAVALQIGQTITLSRAIARLAASEERYRGLFERNLAGVFLTTLDGRIVDCNDACARIFGFRSREAGPQRL